MVMAKLFDIYEIDLNARHTVYDEVYLPQHNGGTCYYQTRVVTTLPSGELESVTIPGKSIADIKNEISKLKEQHNENENTK